MDSLQYPHKIVLLRSGFQYPEKHLFFARARLFFDRIELTGWHLSERHEEMIPLDAVRSIEWREEAQRTTAVLLLDDDRRIELSLCEGHQWKDALALRMSWRKNRPPASPDSSRVFGGESSPCLGCTMPSRSPWNTMVGTRGAEPCSRPECTPTAAYSSG